MLGIIRSTILAVTLFELTVGSTSRGTEATQVGAPAEFRGLDGVPHTLAELNGRPAVVNFWATWCMPCKEEMPRLQSLSEQYQPKGVRFVAISIDDAETQAKIAGLIAKRHFGVTVWTGATEASLKELQLGNILPATLILDESGVPIGKIEGEVRTKDISSRLDWLLNGRQGKQPKLLQKNDW
jgi:thiol-disulfide isomerase/thioredoxin